MIVLTNTLKMIKFKCALLVAFCAKIALMEIQPLACLVLKVNPFKII